jgi:hypothetical protein
MAQPLICFARQERWMHRNMQKVRIEHEPLHTIPGIKGTNILWRNELSFRRFLSSAFEPNNQPLQTNEPMTIWKQIYTIDKYLYLFTVYFSDAGSSSHYIAPNDGIIDQLPSYGMETEVVRLMKTTKNQLRIAGLRNYITIWVIFKIQSLANVHITT